MQVFSALTNLRPFPFNRQRHSSGGTAIGTASSGSSYPGCSVDEAANEGSEEPPGSSLGADSEPPDRYSHGQLLPVYQLDPIERALQYGWFKKAVTIVVVAAAFRSAARARTVCDLLDDVVLPFARVLYRKWRDDGGFFAAKAQAGYRQLTSDPLSLELTLPPSAQQLNPEPESSAMGIDPNNIRIIPVGEKLDAESLPQDVASLMQPAAQPAGDMGNAGTPGEVVGGEAATMSFDTVLDLAAQLAHQSTL